MLHLKELRTQRGLTQSELSKALNVSASSIGMYEQGRREPDNTTLKKIASYFNVTTDYLLGLPCASSTSPSTKTEYPIHASLYAHAISEDHLKEANTFTPEEIDLIKAYRAAPTHIRDIVNTALRTVSANENDQQT